MTPPVDPCRWHRWRSPAARCFSLDRCQTQRAEVLVGGVVEGGAARRVGGVATVAAGNADGHAQPGARQQHPVGVAGVGLVPIVFDVVPARAQSTVMAYGVITPGVARAPEID